MGFRFGIVPFGVWCRAEGRVWGQCAPNHGRAGARPPQCHRLWGNTIVPRQGGRLEADFNPIPAFVSLAQTLYVTAESTGMLSEACTFGSAEVRILDNLNPGPHKFRRFAESCAALGAKKIDLSAPFAAAKSLLGL